MKISRNDPCPCGSGKKHKKCCGASDVATIPAFTAEYFQKRIGTNDFSAYSLMHAKLTNPELARLAHQEAQRISPSNPQIIEQIRSCKSAREVLDLKQTIGIGIANTPFLLEKLMEFPTDSCSELSKDILQIQDDGTFEFMVTALYHCGFKDSQLLAQWVDANSRNPYHQALLGLLWGCIGTKDSIPQVWNLSEDLRIRYPKENYWKGPLMGLWELTT